MSARINLRTYLSWQAMIGRIPGTSGDLQEVVTETIDEIEATGYDVHQTMTWEAWQGEDFGLEGS